MILDNTYRNRKLLSLLLFAIAGITQYTFGQSGSDSTKKTNSAQQAKDQRIFHVVEQPPQFPGGKRALEQFITQNLVVPPTSLKLTGTVNVQFIVNADGSLQDFEVTKGLSQAYNEEALRLVSTMPKWQPGRQSGRALRVRYYLPVAFK